MVDKSAAACAPRPRSPPSPTTAVESQNRFVGCYLDFTDLKLVNAQQVSVSDGFFLGDAQLVFAAPGPKSSVYGVSILGNIWYDCSLPALAVNETQGTWTSVKDLTLSGTSFCGSGQAATGFSAASKTHALDGQGGGSAIAFDFSDVLLFPNAPVIDATASVVGTGATPCSAAVVNFAAAPQFGVAVTPAGCTGTLRVSVDQSDYTTTSTQA